jgi:hypothetical protein
LVFNSSDGSFGSPVPFSRGFRREFDSVGLLVGWGSSDIDSVESGDEFSVG